MPDFFDKTRGKNIRIDDFPFLFIMQSYKGFFGAIFSFVWFAILVYAYRDFWNSTTSIVAALIILGFLFIMVASSWFTQQIVDREIDSVKTIAYWDYYARRSMTILVVLFAVLCSMLIWLTGGISSPFIPFYVMVFTLVLGYCAIPHPARYLWLGYTFAFAAACVLAWRGLPPPVDQKVAADIRAGLEKEGIDFLFALLSMAVPYVSRGLAERRELRRKGRPPSQPGGAPDPAPVTPAS